MKKTLLLFLFPLFWVSCINPELYSDIPYIEFNNIELIKNMAQTDSLARLTFYFQDGDGDIGLDPKDTFPPFTSEFHYNFFADFYEKKNGIFVKLDLPGNFNSRIPKLSNNSPEPIEGTISLNLDIINPTSTSSYDTIYFTFYILDRKLNKSNVAQTSEIIIKKK